MTAPFLHDSVSLYSPYHQAMLQVSIRFQGAKEPEMDSSPAPRTAEGEHLDETGNRIWWANNYLCVLIVHHPHVFLVH